MCIQKELQAQDYPTFFFGDFVETSVVVFESKSLFSKNKMLSKTCCAQAMAFLALEESATDLSLISAALDEWIAVCNFCVDCCVLGSFYNMVAEKLCATGINGEEGGHRSLLELLVPQKDVF